MKQNKAETILRDPGRYEAEKERFPSGIGADISVTVRGAE